MIPGCAQQDLNLFSAKWNGGLSVPNTVASMRLAQACAQTDIEVLEQRKQPYFEGKRMLQPA